MRRAEAAPARYAAGRARDAGSPSSRPWRSAATSRRRGGPPRLGEAGKDRVAIEAHFHQSDLRLVDVAGHLVTNFRLEHVKHGESQRDSGQWAGVGGIAGDDGL